MGPRRVLLVIAAILLLFFPVYVLQVAGELLVFVLILSALISYATRKFLRFKAEYEIIRCFSHERNAVTVTIFNDSLLPIPLLAYRDESGGLHEDGPSAGILFLGPRSSVRISYRVWSGNRGLYKLGPFHCAASDPLGFFPWTRDFTDPRVAFVYPPLAPMSFFARHGNPGGILKSQHPMYTDATQLRSIRSYETGDDPRHINWKASARTGSLQVSEFARTLTVPFYIVLNLADSDFFNKRKSYHLERCVEAAAAFIDQAAREGFSIGFASNASIPAEARRAFAFGEEEIGVIHIPIGNAIGSASSLLSLLSVVSFGKTDIVSVAKSLAFQLAPRILVISPPIAEAEFGSLHALIPQRCRVDFWFLDEHVLRDGKADHRSLPVFQSVHVRKIPEYGEIAPEPARD